MLRRGGLLACAAFGSSVLFGCGTAEGEATAHTELLRGGTVGTARDAVLAIRGARSCAGTLIAPNVVLTSAACLAEVEPGPFQCTPHGSIVANGSGRGQLETFVAADSIVVLAAFDSEVELASGRAIHSPPVATIGCARNLAALELHRPVRGIPTPPLRLTPSTRDGDTLVAAGFGPTDSADRIGYNEAAATVLAVGTPQGYQGPGTAYPGTLELDAGVCSHDEGGPLLDPESGAVVGVLSTAIGGCLEPASRSTATHLPDFEGLIASAFRSADAELSPEPARQSSTGAPRGGAGCAVHGDAAHAEGSLFLAFLLVAAIRGRTRQRRTSHTTTVPDRVGGSHSLASSHVGAHAPSTHAKPSPQCSSAVQTHRPVAASHTG